MAKATARCTCKYCGAEFTKTAIKYNRREADSWEEWAVEHFDECPSCYGKRMREEEATQPVTAAIKLDPYGKKLVSVIFGNTKPRKDEIKGMGYRWGEVPMTGFFGPLTMSRPDMAWYKMEAPEKIDELTEQLEAAGIEVSIEISDADLIAYQDVVQREQQKIASQQEQIDQLEKPVRPDCYPSGRWNGKFYGSPRNGWSIYVDGQKVSVTAEDKATLEAYDEKRAAYQAAVSKIKRGG